MRSNKEKKKGRDDDAEPNAQQVTDCPTKLDENCLGTKCLHSNREDSQFPDEYSKGRKFIEFCRNAFYRFCCCCLMSGDISDSQNCELENNPARSQIRLDSSKYDEHILNENYEIKEIGKGNFGTVFLARCKNSDEKVALKAVKMKRFSLAQRRDINKEKTAWTSASSHPHIVTLISYFKMNTSFCFVSDYVDGQDLTTYLQYNEFLEEAEAKIFAAQVASAITFIHNKGIIHRDISSSNIMLDKTKGAQLIDFGLCTYERNPKDYCGSLFYLCPEILEKKPYDAYCDWWAFAIILYQMLIGQTPMDIYLKKINNIDNMDLTYLIEIAKMAQNVQLQYPMRLSMNAVDMIEDLLQKDLNKRLQEGDIRTHRFFDDVPWPESVHT
ncbi:serine/threonine-protein kinase Sgk2-like [Centruroides sculpturatus]|uniref:serine/threonine-protein kinase Sgk2-like n=1 Tax=Centruroides sculpturatus TaxID=218467 RepID=UPI000C6DC1EF|nr:serine/threonine-protein kinase Sgk2-like [Centruroides sculpturatus]